jgi:hypothetical protein
MQVGAIERKSFRSQGDVECMLAPAQPKKALPVPNQ